MLRGFLLIFVLAALAIIAMAGFRGEKSPRPPWELMPDMVRQPKMRAQAPLGFFADSRGPRLPIAATVPMGYEMPKPQQNAPPDKVAPGRLPSPSRVPPDDKAEGSSPALKLDPGSEKKSPTAK